MGSLLRVPLKTISHSYRDPTIQLTSAVGMAQDHKILVQFKMRHEDQPEAHKVHSPLLASFVTSYARRVLFRALKLLQDRCIYCDTDSIVFESAPGAPEPAIDPHRRLGEWGDELGPGEFISVSGTSPSLHEPAEHHSLHEMLGLGFLCIGAKGLLLPDPHRGAATRPFAPLQDPPER
jgi:hypothetical protein